MPQAYITKLLSLSMNPQSPYPSHHLSPSSPTWDSDCVLCVEEAGGGVMMSMTYPTVGVLSRSFSAVGVLSVLPGVGINLSK